MVTISGDNEGKTEKEEISSGGIKGEIEKIKDEVETELEEAGRGEGETSGIQPTRNEGLEQGPVGTRP